MTSSSSHDRKRSNKRVNKADPLDSPHTPSSMRSLKMHKYTFSSHIQKSFLSWPNCICGGMIYTNNWKETLCLELCWPLFSCCSQWSKLILPLNWFLCTEPSYCEHYYSFQRFSNNFGQKWLPSNTDLIQCLHALPPHSKSYLTSSILNHRGACFTDEQWPSFAAPKGWSRPLPPHVSASAPSSRTGGGEVCDLELSICLATFFSFH